MGYVLDIGHWDRTHVQNNLEKDLFWPQQPSKQIFVPEQLNSGDTCTGVPYATNSLLKTVFPVN